MTIKKASQIKIISVDLFRTLIDLEQTPDLIWQLFLRDNFPEETSRNFRKRADEILSRRWDAAAVDSQNFITVRQILEDTVAELFKDINFNYDTHSAASSLIGDHSLQNIFSDAKPFLDRIGRKFPVCLSTDCDMEMLENIRDIYRFDSLFVSEKLRAYKLNPMFFKTVIRHYNVSPENILHIGDAKSDITTPGQLGIVTCWLNRKNRKWEHDIKPAFEVKSLLEIPDILD